MPPRGGGRVPARLPGFFVFTRKMAKNRYLYTLKVNKGNTKVTPRQTLYYKALTLLVTFVTFIFYKKVKN